VKARAALEQDGPAIVAAVVAAFAQDPAWAFILAQDFDRLAGAFAGTLFDVRVRTQSVWVTEDLCAVAMWDPPIKQETDREYARNAWSRYRALAGENAYQRLTVYDGAVAVARPAEPFWYLGVLATHPQHQRQGLASAAMQPILDRADEQGIACCLETSTAQNRRFYEGRGFTEASDIAIADGPTTWWLRRAPALLG
jgi:GNAT superfamily N-acetyltransferase